MSLNETHDQTFLRRARENLEHCRRVAEEARAALRAANDSVASAKEKYEALFMAAENKERARLLSSYNPIQRHKGLTMTFSDKIEVFRAKFEAEKRAELLRGGMPQQMMDDANYYRATVKPGRKYTNVDFGTSGCYMVVNETGEIFGIKGYGVIHRGHQYGTLDTIADWDWSGYRATKRQAVTA